MPPSTYPDHVFTYVAGDTAREGEKRAQYAELLCVRQLVGHSLCAAQQLACYMSEGTTPRNNFEA